MARYVIFVLAAVASLVFAAQAVNAHHSFASEFDRNRPITLTGTVTKVEWTNPHGRFFVDVKDAAGVVTTWEIEQGSVNSKAYTRPWSVTVSFILMPDTEFLEHVCENESTYQRLTAQ